MNGSQRVIIGVSSSEVRIPEHLRQIPKGEPPHREICLGIPYLDSVQQVGAVPLIIAPMNQDTIESILDTVDGICLSGGPDLDPSTYGAKPHDMLGPTELATDSYEIALARAADARGVPILAICRGAQVLNVARGGTLVQHIPDVYGESVQHRQTELGHHTSHEVIVEPDTLLARTLGTLRAEVNSFHHQSVEKLGQGLKITARSADDGIVEGIEAVDRDFSLGVQWHAESLTNREEHESLFRGLAEAAARYRSDASARRIQAV